MLRKITQNEIDDTYSKYSDAYGGHKEDYFALLYLSKNYGLALEDAAPYVAFGGNDYGVDAFYFSEEKKNLYLYQFKWSANYMLFKDSFQRLTKDGLERIFGNPYQDQNQNQLLIQLKSVLAENRSIIERVFIHFVFDGDVDAAERSSVLDSLREDLESKAYLVNDFFRRDVGLDFQFRSNQRTVSALIESKASHKYEIECDTPLPPS